MRVAYICADPGVPIYGTKGCSVHVQEGVRALASQGADVSLFVSRLGGEPPVDLKHVPFWLLPQSPKGSLEVREKVGLTTNYELAHLLEREGPFDMVYERYSLWSQAGIDHAWMHRVPSVLEVNAPLVEEQARHRGLKNRDGAESVARHVFGAATVLVAVSHQVEAYLKGQTEGHGRIHVIPNGVNADRFRPGLPPARVYEEDRFVVGFVGSLKPWHGLAHLAEAFALLCHRIPDAHLLIVGDGPERHPMTQMLARHGVLDKAHFTGAVSSEDVPRYIAAMDAAVAPYPQLDDCYFSPLKLFEYMASGVPVVASRIGQVSEVIEHGVSGMLCPPGDANALASALAQLKEEPRRARRMAHAAREKVLRDHTWNAVFKTVLQVAGYPVHKPAGTEVTL